MQGGDDEEEEVLDISYTNISRVVTDVAPAAQHRSFAGCFIAELQCKAFPACMGQDVAAAAAQGTSGAPFSLGLVLRERQRDKLIQVLESKVGIRAVRLAC